ncbi:phospholipid carrier-dependent glycosyltransferase [Patescibacteria group bacterium]|nr:phospholipid carrier-dependent glycosyltransferase [Patescibacteria group bacterium]
MKSLKNPSENILDQCFSIWRKYNTKFVLALLLAIFSAFAIFIALNLNTGYIPDETYRFEVATYFADTWGIPEYIPIAYTSGDNLHRNPFLGYWLYGRALSLFQLFIPGASEWQNLVSLRIFNWLFALGTVLFTYGISKELIKNKWWQLLPVFLLTNTLMFVFLSGGVNYDNPTNLACTASLYFLVRLFNKKDFLSNSLGWLICISFASLIKYSVLPLVLALSVAWVVYIFKNRDQINLIHLKTDKSIVLITILAILIGFNFSIYGINLIKFQSLTPTCVDTFSHEVCSESFFGRRHLEMALPEKLTLIDAFRQGYPDPIRYVFDVWIREMLNRIFGIMGEQVYFPIIIAYYHIALYWIVLLGFRYIKKPSFKIASLFGIFIFYALVLLNMNYNSELVYGFYKFVALQGRYIFPVISIAFVIYAYILTKVTNKAVRLITLFATVLLFLYGGPIRFIWYFNSVFSDWFI